LRFEDFLSVRGYKGFETYPWKKVTLSALNSVGCDLQMFWISYMFTSALVCVTVHVFQFSADITWSIATSWF